MQIEFKLGIVDLKNDKNKRENAPIITLVLDTALGDLLPDHPEFSWHRLVKERLPEANETKFFPITYVPGKKRKGENVVLSVHVSEHQTSELVESSTGN
jgi:hypothetical protein